jgi:predicted dehydrogenase
MGEVNVAFLGAGIQLLEDHGPAYQELAGEGVRLAAVADTDLARARTMAERFGVPAAYGSLGELLAAQRDLHALVIAVPNAAHAPMAIQASNAGLHVFVEKPMAIDSANAVAMAEAARRRRRLLWVSSQYREMVPIPTAMILEGDIGRVQVVRARWFRQDIPGKATFNRRDLAGGGAGVDLIPHLLAVALPALGLPEPTAASARMWQDRGRRAHGPAFEVEDRLQGVVDLTGGTRLVIDVGWGSDISDVAVTFEGAEGTLDVPLLTGQPHTPGYEPGPQRAEPVWHRNVGGTPLSLPVTSPGHPRSVWACIQAQTRGFVQAIRRHAAGDTASAEVRRADETVALGLLTMRILDLLYESAEAERVGSR